jgi:hypothetical protein
MIFLMPVFNDDNSTIRTSLEQQILCIKSKTYRFSAVVDS